MSDTPEQLALDISRCGEIPRAMRDAAHPCRKVVSLQAAAGDDRHLPEAWAGNLERARVIFVSSNPSLSEEGDYLAGEGTQTLERFPTARWPDDEVIDFVVNRFGHTPPAHATADGYRRCLDGEYRGPVRFWPAMRNRARELLGPAAEPYHDYCMTEVVHCKSRKEIGVQEAAALCPRLYLERTLALSSAPVVVLVGKHAYDHVSKQMLLPGRPGPLLEHRSLGGSERLLTFLWGPASAKPKTFATLYSDEQRRAIIDFLHQPRSLKG